MMRLPALLLAAILLTTPAFAQNVPIEPDAYLSPPDTVPRSQLLAAMDASVALIRASGWRCDTISGFRVLLWETGYNIHCNQFRYHYEVKDRGGRWVAELK
jgi:hypothetical protein